MTKAEIIEAINSTIVTNGQKGITAESLANLLIEMASATPEGSGGSGGLYVYASLPAEMIGVETSITAEQQAHNAEVYAKCLECFNNKTPLPVIVADLSNSFGAAMGVECCYTEVSFNSIFTPVEVDGIVGLTIMTKMLQTCMIAEDGSVTVSMG